MSSLIVVSHFEWYPHTISCLLQDLFRQVFVTAAFSVFILVVPVLLRLNKIPRWIIFFLSYPLYQFSVGKSNAGDFFSPNVHLSLHLLCLRPSPAIWRVLGAVIGGFAGGLVMNRFFPDEDAGKHIKKD